MNLERIDTLTFDVVGTLIDFETGILEWCRPWLRQHGRRVDDDSILAAFAEAEDELQQAHPEMPFTAMLPRIQGMLAARVEGNLLAAAQEIDKLLLMGGEGPVDADRVAEVVADSARWSIFDLADAVLDGAPDRVARIVAGLRAEGTQPPVIAWALQRELAQMATIAARRAEGQGLGAAMQAVGVWQRRQGRVRGATDRFDVRGWQRLLAGCARLERLAKGAARGSFWDELVELALAAAGSRMAGLAPRRAVEVER